MDVSANNTIVRESGGIITNAAGDTWQIVNGTVIVNGVADQTTANVVLLAYENGRVWQENADRRWWSKSNPSDAWGPPRGTTVSPLTGVASVNNTVQVGSVVAGLLTPAITDKNDDKWTIAANGQVAVNGVADPTTSRVIALAYKHGRVWQENADLVWWSKRRASDAWSPPNGTRQSPVPAHTVEPGVLYLDGTVVNYSNSVTPAKYSVTAVADGDKGITFNYGGDNINSGMIRNDEGNLTLFVAGMLTNSGSLTTQGGIGNAFTNINIVDRSSVFRNTGIIETLYSSIGAIGGHLHVYGAGTFYNDGIVRLDGGSSADFGMSGDIFNSGRLLIDDLSSTFHTVIVANISNSGTIENQAQTTIQWGYSGPPQSLPDSTFINDGLIRDLGAGQLILAAGVFAHNADGSLVHEYHGALVNNGQILASGSGASIEIAAPLKQSDGGRVEIQDGATVKLDSTSDGGTIDITAGTLDFGGDRVTFHGPAAASGMHADVVLDGASAAFNFERSDISAAFLAASPTTGDLFINLTATGAPEQIADIHLVGAYHASQFQLSGNEVLYTQAS